MKCPQCTEDCDREEVNVGVGIIYGPWGCYSCGWSEYDRKQAEVDNPGWYCDSTGGLHRISAIADKLERFGIPKEVTEDVFRSSSAPTVDSIPERDSSEPEG